MSQAQGTVEEGIDLPIRTDHWRRIFNKYDRNTDGQIEISEFKEILNSTEYENDIPPLVVERIFSMSDTDNNGYIDFEEFTRMMLNPRLEPIFGRFAKRYVNAIIPRRHYPRTRTDDVDGLYEDQYTFCPPPVAMLLISLVEIILFTVDVVQSSSKMADGPVAEELIFNCRRRKEAWRFITYMFVHVGILHLVVNLAVQIMLGTPLEMVHRGWRVLIIYFAGVLAGSLGTSITDPRVNLAGASGGVYALITAHISSVIMNWKEMQFAAIQLAVFLIITGVDLGTAIYDRYYQELDSKIGYAAHLSGAVTGLLVGIFILRNLRVNSWEKKLWWISLITFIALITTAVIWNISYPSYFPEQEI